MRLEYTEAQEIDLRITEIEAILENELYEDGGRKMELIKELAELYKQYAFIEDWDSIWEDKT